MTFPDVLDCRFDAKIAYMHLKTIKKPRWFAYCKCPKQEFIIRG